MADEGRRTVRRDGDWLSAPVGEEIVMMSAREGTYLGLSPVSARIWELLETPTTLDALCERLVAEFAVTPQICRAEVTAFLDQMAAHRAVAFDATPAR